MALREPQSMNECIYFTNRSLDKGEVMAWVYRKDCPKCKKAKMGKPVVKGKVKTRADEYECPACGYREQKQEHEESLRIEAKYTCPHCGKKGESVGQYKRKNYQGVPSYVVNCQHCQEVIPVTKKLKEPKKGKKASSLPSDDEDTD
jgi:transcription elongation factor Elf1